MNLSQLYRLLGWELSGPDQAIASLEYDSRKVKAGSLFFAIPGEADDGHSYIQSAFDRGALAVIGEKPWPGQGRYLQVFSTKKALALAAHNFFGKPSANLHLVGVTGTNGKTTITSLIHQVYEAMGQSCGLIGTNEWLVGVSKKSTHTTPMSVELNQLLAEGVGLGLERLAMEVSSHGIKENRVDHISFDRFIFTNLTPDHLDYHKTFDDYVFTKMRPFIQISDYCQDKMAIINLDDPHGPYFINATSGRLLTYGFDERADFSVRDPQMRLDGSTFQLFIKGQPALEVNIPIFGRHNISNVLAVLAYFHSLGYDLQLVAQCLQDVSVEGRAETIKTGSGITILIDYAHNPDGIYRIISSAASVTKGRVLTVLGAGGHRDRLKRKVMGRHALDLSGHVFFTSDNPRDEDPLAIIQDLITDAGSDPYTILIDRKEAIETALLAAKSGDCVAILGKGHEKTQNINGKIIPFSDKIVVEEVIRKRGI